MFAKCHWNYERNKVLWSDETEIWLFGHVHRQHVWCQKRDAYKEKHLIPLSNMMVNHWYFGAVLLPEVQDFLAKTWLPLPGNWDFGHRLIIPKRQWAQTKSRNGSVNTKSMFCNGHQSPDFNPIEYMRSELKRAVHKHKPKDMKDLEKFCMEEWSKIPPNVFSNLIKHRNRLSACIFSRGGYTKY